MKITHFEVIPYNVSFVKPLQNSGNTYYNRQGFWLKLRWKNFSGWGEAAPLEGFSQDTLKEVQYILEGYHHAIKGEILDQLRKEWKLRSPGGYQKQKEQSPEPSESA